MKLRKMYTNSDDFIIAQSNQVIVCCNCKMKWNEVKHIYIENKENKKSNCTQELKINRIKMNKIVI